MFDEVIVGGAGVVGSAVARACALEDRKVLVVDQRDEELVRSAGLLPDDVRYQQVDLSLNNLALPDGRVLLAHGISQPRIAHPWQLVAAHAWTTARLLRSLHGRNVTLLSTVEVYGTALGLISTKTTPVLPLGSADIRRWCTQALAMARTDVSTGQVIQHCRALIEVDSTGRWAYALSKRAQELLLMDAEQIPELRVLRVANVLAPGQERVIERVTRRLIAGLPVSVSDAYRTFVHLDDLVQLIVSGRGSGVINAGTAGLSLSCMVDVVREALGVETDITTHHVSDDSSGHIDTGEFNRLLDDSDPNRLHEQVVVFAKRIRHEMPAPLLSTIPVVIPPRPEQPDVVADQTSRALASGVVKGGGPVSQRLSQKLRSALALPDDRELILTSSGTAALRLAIVASAGTAQPGDVALMPSFTFAATAEAAAQLGYRLQFCDVDPATWTLDAKRLSEALQRTPAKVVIAVDALGNPADYARLREVCDAADVVLVGDSAASLGSRLDGHPVGAQADVHAFSMSFAKTVSAAGAGGFLTLPREWVERLTSPVDWTRSAMLGEVHAAVALDQVLTLPRLLGRRDAVAEIYADLALASAVVRPQVVREGAKHSWVHWTAAYDVEDRSLLGKELEILGVHSKPYYAPALHHLDWNGQLVPGSELPVTEWLAKRVLALPMSSEMTTADADAVLWRVLHALNLCSTN